MVMQLEMQDRSAQRRDIVNEVWAFLLERHSAANYAMQIRDGMLRLRALGASLGVTLDESRVWLTEQTRALLSRDREVAMRAAEALTGTQLVSVRTDAIGIGRFALGASIAADEALRGERAPVVSGAGGA